MNISYRQYEEHDLPGLAALNQELLAADGRRGQFTDAQLIARFREWLSNDHVLTVFIVGDELVGYVLYSIGVRDNDEKLVFIRHFIIKDEQRRKGYGRNALEYLTKHAWPKDAQVYVETREDNTPAITFWQHFGFRRFSCVLKLER